MKREYLFTDRDQKPYKPMTFKESNRIRSFKTILVVLIVFIKTGCYSQDTLKNSIDSISFSGQLSSWININAKNPLPVYTGIRYIPSFYASEKFRGKYLFDIEASANISGSLATHPFDSADFSGLLKPYRLWLRYSSDQFELRLGLQKINFGSASILRPLMWFDQMDPRDPLHLTDGVWGLLGRYYFLNNTNIWLWGLYGNNSKRGWELVPVNKRIPEFGGRIQFPVPGGEAGLSYHHRIADNRGINLFSDFYEKIPEDRFGIDARWNLLAGFWIEGSLTRKRSDLGIFTNQEILNAGIDYTFGLGNGLYAAYEHLLVSFDERPFRFAEKTSFSLLTVNYALGLFDRVSGILYFNWQKNVFYNFLTWQKQFDNIIVYFMGYWNPVQNDLPDQIGSQNYYSGKGLQVMFVFNH